MAYNHLRGKSYIAAISEAHIHASWLLGSKHFSMYIKHDVAVCQIPLIISRN